jgi:hypothetical protein
MRYTTFQVDVRKGIQRKIELKRKEVADLELKIRDAQSYIRALEDTLRIVDGEEIAENGTRGTRADSDVGKSQDALKRAGKPLHITEILKVIGKPDDKRSRISLGGTLAGYVHRGRIFTRPGPNIFGLIEFDKGAVAVPSASATPEAPDDFGIDGSPGLTDDDVPF